MTTLKQAQEKAREKLMRKYDIRYFDGSTYAVDEEFQKDLDQIIKQAREDLVHEVEKEKLPPNPDNDAEGDIFARGYNRAINNILNKFKSEV